MPDDLNPAASLESPPTTPDPEPEGVKEVQGEKLVPVAALVKERERVREAEREKAAKEVAPIRQRLDATEVRAQQLEAQLRALQAAQAPKPPDVPSVSDDEAEKFARQYELYTPTGLDLARAKQIIARNREETTRIAKQAAQEAVQPYAQTTAQQASRNNFVWAASQKGSDGSPLVDPHVLAEQWSKLPVELTSQPDVAQWVLRAAIGEAAVTGKRPSTPTREPVFSESAGGQRAPAFTMSSVDKKLANIAGIGEKEFADRAKSYQPGATNFLE